MEKFPHLAFDVKWLPFQLDDSLPAEGVDKVEMYNRKFGPARVAAMLPHMKSVFENVGLSYAFGGKVGNTFDSHRAIYLASLVGKEDAMVEELFKNYFSEQKNLGDPDVLQAACRTIGAPEVAEQLKDPNEGREAVANQLLENRAKRITGVPHFTINGRMKISGAQPPEVFEEIFEELEDSP